jgi:hypothetical protein
MGRVVFTAPSDRRVAPLPPAPSPEAGLAIHFIIRRCGPELVADEEVLAVGELDDGAKVWLSPRHVTSAKVVASRDRTMTAAKKVQPTPSESVHPQAQNPADEETIEVNSYHHQAIRPDQPAPDLAVSGTTDDGELVGAFEAANSGDWLSASRATRSVPSSRRPPSSSYARVRRRGGDRRDPRDAADQ